MILAALTSTALGFGASAGDLPPAALERAQPAVVIEVEETRVAVRSASLDPVLLVVAPHDGAPALTCWLPPGCGLDAEFARGALDELRIEAVLTGERGWLTTGALAFPQAGPGETAMTWVFDSGVALTAKDDGPLAPEAPQESLLPQRVQGLIGTPSGDLSQTPSSPLHVPVPAPCDRVKGDKPPKLEDKPLPPV